MKNEDSQEELSRLRFRVAALEQLLDAHEQAVLKQTAQLELAVQDLEAQAEAMRTILKGTATATGNEFFQPLVFNLARALKVRRAFVGVVDGTAPPRVRTLAVWNGAEFGANVEYALKGTPCEKVLLGKEFRRYASEVKRLFPDDPRLADWSIAGYGGSPLLDRDGRVLGILVVMDDQPITTTVDLMQIMAVFAARAGAELERSQLEYALREGEQRLRNILDSMFAFVGLLSTDGIVLEVNRAPLEAASLRREDVIGQPAADTYWWSYSSSVQAQLRGALQAAAQGRTVRYDVPIRVGEDRFMTIDVTFGPIYDSAGRVMQVVGSAVDISERKRAEAALEETRVRFERVADGSSDGMWDWNIVTGEDYLSPRWKALLGFRDEELPNRQESFFDRMHPDDAEPVQAALQAHFERDERYDVELRLRRKDGDYRWFRARGQVVRDG
ncbi:MAG: PAS domain S-box protein, partial [Nitrospira sp.]|nr:PAS domain S-box protein [Nitrospira sp.]